MRRPAKASSRTRPSATAAASSAPVRQPLPRNSTTPASASTTASAQAQVAEGSRTAAIATRTAMSAAIDRFRPTPAIDRKTPPERRKYMPEAGAAVIRYALPTPRRTAEPHDDAREGYRGFRPFGRTSRDMFPQVTFGYHRWAPRLRDAHYTITRVIDRGRSATRTAALTMAGRGGTGRLCGDAPGRPWSVGGETLGPKTLVGKTLVPGDTRVLTLQSFAPALESARTGAAVVARRERPDSLEILCLVVPSEVAPLDVARGKRRATKSRDLFSRYINEPVPAPREP